MLQVFDVLHLDGRSTRALPYRERRALLEELALDGPAWRTPGERRGRADRGRSSRASRSSGWKASSPSASTRRYLPGRRSTSWVKHKLRREERLAVTGLRRTRPMADSTRCSSPAGSRTARSPAPDRSSSGFAPSSSSALERRLAELPARRRGAVAWYPAEVSVVASLHGLPDGPVRDAVLREVLDGVCSP